MKKIVQILNKYKQIILYLIVGFLTTFVNFAIYFLFTNLFGINYLVSNCIAWIGAVVFAYFTNKFYVFESKNKVSLFKEFMLFVGSRFFSFLIETLLLFVGVQLLKVKDGIAKVVVAIIVVILNYIFTKFVFKER